MTSYVEWNASKILARGTKLISLRNAYIDARRLRMINDQMSKPRKRWFKTYYLTHMQAIQELQKSPGIGQTSPWNWPLTYLAREMAEIEPLVEAAKLCQPTDKIYIPANIAAELGG